MNKTLLCIALFLLASASVAADQNVCPCIPLSHEWIVTACESWECAQSALSSANGDPYVVAVPNGSPNWKWLVLRRVVTGSVIVSPDAPFGVEQFEGVAEAAARFASIDHENFPQLMSMVDGKLIVIAMKPGRRRAAPR